MRAPRQPVPAGPTEADRPGTGSPELPGANRPASEFGIDPNGPGSGGPTPGSPLSRLAGEFGTDSTSWVQWWQFNQDPYLYRVRTSGPATGVGSERARRVGPRTALPLRATDVLVENRILPVLLEVVDERPSVWEVEAALHALGRLGGRDLEALGARIGVQAAANPGGAVDDAAIQAALAAYVADDDSNLSENALLALGVHAGIESAPMLAAVLNDERLGRRATARPRISDRLRAHAAYALGLTALRSGSPDLAQFASRTLLDALESRSVPLDVRVACAVALGATSDSDAGMDWHSTGWERRVVQRTVELLGERKLGEEARSHLATSLARFHDGLDAIGREELFNELFALLAKRERADVRRGAVLALGQVATAGGDDLDRHARKLLLEELEASDLLTRFFATVSLGRAGGRPSQTGEAPFAAGESVRDALLERLDEVPSTERPWVAMGIGILERGRLDAGLDSDPVVVEALAEAFSEERNHDVRASLYLAAGLAGLDGIETFLDDEEDPAVISFGLVGLALSDGTRTLSALEPWLETCGERHELLFPAGFAAATAGSADLVPLLLARLDGTKCASERQTLVALLGETGSAAGVEPLIDLARDARASAFDRAAAIAALGRLADRDDLPWRGRLSHGINYVADAETLTSPSGGGVLDAR